jgi:hypothetical protein
MKITTTLLCTWLFLSFAPPAGTSEISTSTESTPVTGAAAETRLSVTDRISSAIERGVPLFNGGDHQGCARVYVEAARELLRWEETGLSRLNRHELQTALDKAAPDASTRAWNIRHAFDRILENERFEPLVEAPLPEGFPGPGPLGRVVVKKYPKYRAARAEGGNSFWTLFQHIKKNDVQMTAPVEMTMSDEMRETDMSFLYEGPEQGASGSDGMVKVLDLEPVTVLSIGLRGRRSRDTIDQARDWIQEHMTLEGWCKAGSWRTFGYNSPMVGASRSFWELQIPVIRCEKSDG